MAVQHRLDQASLRSNTGVAKSSIEDGQRRSIQCRSKPFVAGRDPSRAGGTRKPRNLGRLGGARLKGRKVFSRRQSHIVEIGGYSGCNLVRIDAVDEVDHRYALAAVVGNHAIQSIGRNGSDNQGVSVVFRDAFGDLALLCRKVFIPAGLVQIKCNAQSLCLVDQAEIHSQPIIVFEVRNRSTYAPRPARSIGWRVLLYVMLMLRVEWR